MVERRIPLLISIEGRTPWRDVYALLSEVPDLTCVLCDIGVWGVDRYTWPLLDKYPNVYIETSQLSIEAGGLEAGVAKFGADRFLFGSGFPLRYPEAAAMQLIHSEVSDSDKQNIASKNLERLISEVKL
jgi:predicted TIM-barrel fold metal-dependent hydrolase